jgi:hypothetical protein
VLRSARPSVLIRCVVTVVATTIPAGNLCGHGAVWMLSVVTVVATVATALIAISLSGGQIIRAVASVGTTIEFRPDDARTAVGQHGVAAADGTAGEGEEERVCTTKGELLRDSRRFSQNVWIRVSTVN